MSEGDFLPFGGKGSGCAEGGALFAFFMLLCVLFPPLILVAIGYIIFRIWFRRA